MFVCKAFLIKLRGGGRQAAPYQLGVLTYFLTVQFYGPILFTVYTVGIGRLISTFGFCHHICSCDTELYCSCNPDDRADFI